MTDQPPAELEPADQLRQVAIDKLKKGAYRQAPDALVDKLIGPTYTLEGVGVDTASYSITRILQEDGSQDWIVSYNLDKGTTDQIAISMANHVSDLFVGKDKEPGNPTFNERPSRVHALWNLSQSVVNDKNFHMFQVTDKISKNKLNPLVKTSLNVSTSPTFVGRMIGVMAKAVAGLELKTVGQVKSESDLTPQQVIALNGQKVDFYINGANGHKTNGVSPLPTATGSTEIKTDEIPSGAGTNEIIGDVPPVNP